MKTNSQPIEEHQIRLTVEVEPEEIEKAHPEYKSHISPTQRVGGPVLESFKKVTHARMMLSLANAFDKDEVLAFDRRVRESLNVDSITYMAEMKIDMT